MYSFDMRTFENLELHVELQS